MNKKITISYFIGFVLVIGFIFLLPFNSLKAAFLTNSESIDGHTATQNITLDGNWLSGDGGNEGVFILSNGNVGVGTNNPGEKFDVSGKIRTNSQLISTVANGTAPLVVTSSTMVDNLNANFLQGYRYDGQQLYSYSKSLVIDRSDTDKYVWVRLSADSNNPYRTYKITGTWNNQASTLLMEINNYTWNTSANIIIKAIRQNGFVFDEVRLTHGSYSYTRDVWLKIYIPALNGTYGTSGTLSVNSNSSLDLSSATEIEPASTIIDSYSGLRGKNTSYIVSGISEFNQLTSLGNTVLAINSGFVGIGTTAPGARLDVRSTDTYSILAGLKRIGNVADPGAATDAATKGYVDSVAGDVDASKWGVDGSDIYNKYSGKVIVGTLMASNSSYRQMFLQGGSTGHQTLNLGSVESSVGSYIYNNAYYLTSNTYIPSQTAASGMQMRNDGSLDLLTNSGLTIGTAYTPTSRIKILANGNVGIGTTNPLQQLHLTKSLRLETTTASDVGVIYKGTNRFIHNFQASGKEGRNTFIGEYAGNFTMNGINSFNASNNIGIGYSSLNAMTTGYQNVALGVNTLKDNTTGTTNTAIGHASLEKNISGYSNTALGYAAAGDNTTGYNNTAFGYATLRKNTGGAMNTAIGRTALSTKVGGDYNTALGFHAGSSISGGTDNTSVSNSVYLGALTKASAVGNTNEIVIGYNAIGKGSNTATYGNTTITSHIFESGNVGIGTVNPGTNKLFVNGTVNISGATAIRGPVSFYSIQSGETDRRLTFNLNSANTATLYNYDEGGTTFHDIKIGGTTATNVGLLVKAGGSVGIGTTAPGASLDVRSTATYSIYAGLKRIGNVADPGAATDAATKGYVDSVSSLVDASKWTTSGSNIYNKNSGNVGVGTNNPGAKLDVANGLIRQSGYLVSDAATDNLIVNGDFEMGMLYGWSSGGAPTVVTGGYSGNYAMRITGNGGETLSQDYIPVDPKRDVLHLEAWVKKTVAGAAPGTLYFGYIAYNENKSPITSSPCGTYCYFAASNYTIPNDGAWHKISAITTGEGTSYPNFPVGTKYVRVLGLINYGGSTNTVTDIDHVTVKRLRTGAVFVGDVFNGTNQADRYQISKLYTTTSNNLIIENSGNVGVGTTGPSAKLDVRKSGGIVGRFTQTGTWTGSEWALYVTGYSNLGGYRLNAADGVRGIHKVDSGGIMGFSTTGNDPITFTQLNTVERMRIDAGGNVGIGSTIPDYKLDVAGPVAALEFNYDSDRSLKKNIKTINNSLNKILKLRGVTFDWKESGETSVGLVAQEVEKVFPELVKGKEGGKSVQYGNLVAPLIEAVKEQQKLIDILEARITELENRR